jgi:hypothetical protein
MKENTYRREKGILLELISMIAIFAFYALYIYNKYISNNPERLNDIQFLAKAFFIFLPIAIVAEIIIHIIFFIINKILTDEEVPVVKDERDKLIELRALRIYHWVSTLGFIAAIATQALGFKPWVMLVVFISFGLVSAIVSGISRYIFYSRGF